MNSLKSWTSRCYRRRTEVRRGIGRGVREALIYSAFAVGDSLAADPGERFDVVLTNPPFGKKSSTTIVGEEGIDLLMHVTTVSVETVWVTQAMAATVR